MRRTARTHCRSPLGHHAKPSLALSVTRAGHTHSKTSAALVALKPSEGQESWAEQAQPALA